MDEQPAPPVADGEDHALDPRMVAWRRTTGWIVTAVVALGLLVVLTIIWLAVDNMPGWIAALMPFVWLGVVLLNAWTAHYLPVLQYRRTRYRVDDRGIEIRQGVYFRVVINVPRSRVQHTDVSQGPLERQFGLGTLVINTAGTDHAMVTLAGLEHGVALGIREHLLPPETGDAV